MERELEPERAPAMPLFRKKSSALMELEGMDRQPSSELSPSPGVLDELRRDQPLRSSMHLVPEAHEADGVGDELVRGLHAVAPQPRRTRTTASRTGSGPATARATRRR